MIGHNTCLAESLRHVGGGFQIVFDNQYFHVRDITAGHAIGTTGIGWSNGTASSGIHALVLVIRLNKRGAEDPIFGAPRSFSPEGPQPWLIGRATKRLPFSDSTWKSALVRPSFLA